jgi:hypothetical protein
VSDDLVTRLRRIGERVKVPCPDEIKGCLVFHYRIETDPTCAEAADEIERLLEEQQKATLYAESLAVALSRHFPHVPQWRPFTGDLIGLLTQIDNMTTGLLPAHEVERLRTENERLRVALRYYAENHYPNVNDGPWGVNSTDFGDVARAALTDKGEKP